MRPFCMGSGITMGTTGIRLAGVNSEDDCVMLWTETFGVTSVGRAIIANVVVFLMALAAQFLTASSANKFLEAKTVAKKRRLSALLNSPNLFYDAEIGGPDLKAKAAATAKMLASVQHDSGGDNDSDSPTKKVGNLPAITALDSSMKAKAYQEALAPTSPHPVTSVKVDSWTHFGDSLLHGLRIFIAYLLMLAAMTYDVGLIVSIVAGFMVGYYCFAQDTAKVPTSADPCCS
ncbi:TPA: hypothetical protein N0F65_011530 [Lagenidium giganteum]|uniref:Copper transport protein n=1 Tax=Lagenidium giganteum TaxID=4803 RepID=A0AAV2Z829_9STRA|nr:TPA: hypothetical protein N0F65_011530 [Lagenidium giganteum]